MRSTVLPLVLKTAPGTIGLAQQKRMDNIYDLNRKYKIVNGVKVDFWTCISFSLNVDPSIFCHELISMSCNKGMEFRSEPLVHLRSANPPHIEMALFDIHTESTSRLAGVAYLVYGGRAKEQLQELLALLQQKQTRDLFWRTNYSSKMVWLF
ncbi:argonaute family protein [Dorcoceras hygrometricum]|uniref:Argonaute family protein n=1 Tax=Dorcoceras hygrometricum TaxID=472368 RepID=A0A2Z7A6Q8_9LAMI|nr:argonaute family protein [Dorcoceras hygrometricum]